MSGQRVGGGVNSVMYRRVARKVHWCGCGNRIAPGDVYLSHIAFPGHDALGYGVTGPQRLAECARCACRYGRSNEVWPSYEQCAREGLL